MVRDSCSSMADDDALAMVYGWIEGVKNLWNQLDGRLMRENMRVKVCPRDDDRRTDIWAIVSGMPLNT